MVAITNEDPSVRNYKVVVELLDAGVDVVRKHNFSSCYPGAIGKSYAFYSCIHLYAREIT